MFAARLGGATADDPGLDDAVQLGIASGPAVAVRSSIQVSTSGPSTQRLTTSTCSVIANITGSTCLLGGRPVVVLTAWSPPPRLSCASPPDRPRRATSGSATRTER